MNDALATLDALQPIINFHVALLSGLIGLWSFRRQRKLKRAGLRWQFLGSAALVLLAPGLLLTSLPSDLQLVRAFILRVLFLVVYVSWGFRSIRDEREWSKTMVVVSNGSE